MYPAGASGRLELRIKHKSYRTATGGRLHVLGGLSIALAKGEVAALVGPSGCGKTTLLRIIMGLDRDFEGVVSLPAGCRLGVVFQEPRLLPWRTVEENVQLTAPQASAAALSTLFATLGLTEHRLHYPGELSLGQARRLLAAQSAGRFLRRSAREADAALETPRPACNRLEAKRHLRNRDPTP